MAKSNYPKTDTQVEEELRARLGLGAKMLTNGGYGLVGGGFFAPMLTDKPLEFINYVAILLGIVFLAAALYISPMGAKSDD